MSRKQIIDAIADVSNISKTAAKSALETVESLIVSGLVAHGEFQIDGVGKLKVKTRAARTGRNPKTGEPISIAESKGVSFTTAKALKTALNP